MNSSLLQVNQLIEIEIEREKNSGELVKELYSSRIEDKDNDTLTIAYPLKNGYPVPIRNNEEIKIKIIYKQDAYIGEVTVISQTASPILLLKVTKPKKMVKIQMRNWVRHPCFMPVNYVVLSEGPTVYKANSLDISGGGMLLQTKHDWAVNTSLYIEFTLDNCLIKANSKVVRSTPMDKEYKTAIEYEKMLEREREQIVRFIFQKQRELLRKNIL